MRSSAKLVAVATLSTSLACATAPAPVHISSDLAVGRMAERTSFEREVDSSDASPKARKVTPALFWTGVVLGSLGVVGTVAFGAAGHVTNNKIDDGYDDGLTRSEHADLVDRGEALNVAAITSAAVGLFGIGLAAAAYGYDYTHCGPLAAKKRRCKER